MTTMMQAKHFRHLRTMWRNPDIAWHWWALYTGRAQPVGHRNYWHDRWRWQLHVTPLHLHRHVRCWELGLCFGARTVYAMRHR